MMQRNCLFLTATRVKTYVVKLLIIMLINQDPFSIAKKKMCNKTLSTYPSTIQFVPD